MIGQLWRSAPVRIAAGLLLAALVLAAAGWMVTGPLRSYPAAFDSSIRAAMRGMQSPMWTSLFLAVTKLGSTVYLTIIGCAAGLVFIALRWWRVLILLIVAMAGQAALHHGFKWLIARPRPSALIAYPPAESFSFPSGHAISALCLYALIAWIFTSHTENSALKAGIWILTIVLVFLVGMSRVYIGVHYSSDVLAGFAAATVWTTAIISADEHRL